ncbi:MAG: translesion DNA synthesis-associated protein ImuA [Proteobacteria bacterium]|jgi:cell division inhibitor SulA|nr:translesion DNA synthesis-associated protein ImuA [Pseudomonadota bacterium]MDA1289978.1 translesion DNA synthesis-associated protein ImuA [Pseudomonadota bacterium]
MTTIQNHSDTQLPYQNQYPSTQADAFHGAGSSDIDELIQGNPKLWRGCDMAGQSMHGRSTGFTQLDAILPGRGWPEKGLMEIITPHWGMGELQLLIPLMRSIVEQGKWILWISPPYLLYAPALVQAGINTDQVLVVKLDTSCKDALWSMEKALQTENCGLVLAWQNWLPTKVLRRLQLAAETGDTLGVLFKHHDSEHSPSPIRLKIQDSYSENAGFNESEVTVIKARGNFRSLSANINLYQQA